MESRIDMGTMQYILFATLLVILSSIILRRTGTNKATTLKGPKSPSWIYGNMVEFMLEIPGGKTVSSWFDEYGATLMFNACLGQRQFLTSDPAAIKHILNNTADFGKSPAHSFINIVLFGPGSVLYKQGEAHRQTRTISNPMFSASTVRRSIPLLQNVAHKLCTNLLNQPNSVADVYPIIHSTTLQSITGAVMGYEPSDSDPYTAAYGNLVMEISQRTKSALLSGAVLACLPVWMIKFIKDHPPAAFQKFFRHRMLAREISSALLNKKRESSERIWESQNVDLFSTLVSSNDKSPTPMSDDELHDQFGTLTIAGQDTTASTLLWILYALSTNSKWQDLLRQEVNQAFSQFADEIEYDKLPVLNAVIKETLRVYTAIPYTERVAKVDTVIPLSRQTTTATGHSITELKIKKGQTVVISITDYNRSRSIWGDDASTFDPSRWIDKQETGKGTSIGPYASLLSFLGGPRVCLGWRFAILQLQVMTAEMVKTFSFSLPDGVTIQKATAISLIPVNNLGEATLPLDIKRAE